MFSRILTLAAALGLLLGANPALVSAQTPSGAFLAARQADAALDFRAAADFYLDVVFYDPDHSPSRRGAVAALLGAGDMVTAGELAQDMIESREVDAAGLLAAIGLDALDRDYDAIIALLEEPDISINPLTDGLVLAWAYLGVGDADKALEKFDEVSSENGLAAFGLYHKALALAWMGDLEGADAVFEEVARQGVQSRRSAISHVQVLSQLGLESDALEKLTRVFGAIPDVEIAELARELEAGRPLSLTTLASPADGIAEVFYSVAEALSADFADLTTLLYVRLAQGLRPTDTDTQLLTAEILEKLGRRDLAQDVYAEVAPGSYGYFTAAVGVADVLRSRGDYEASIVQLSSLISDYGDRPMLYVTMGDVYRQMQEYNQAVISYSEAIRKMEPNDPQLWYVYYVRGISYERIGDWPKSDGDFRQSLELQPNRPQVLNYLGYSLVERRENLDEALAMIERAVALRPNSGYIVDSLGWVYYRLGRFEDAVEPMERATELMATDPIVNDHLGDVYWMVGRFHEARFQWQRALSFDPEEAEAERIRRKLDVGLDVVLAEEASEND